MNSNQDFAVNMAVNEAAMISLNDACPAQLGMPAKLIQELVFGKYPVLTAEDVLGVSGNVEGTMLEEYLNKKGYSFSWGTLSEESYPVDPDDPQSPPVVRFEFTPIDLLLEFPQSAQLEDLFIWLYRNHSLYDDRFACVEGYSHWSVISFESDEGCEDALRRWVAGAFIPLIWHDILAEALRIVAEKKAAAIAQSSDGSYKELLVERDRGQLCVDPSELQFAALDLLEDVQ